MRGKHASRHIRSSVHGSLFLCIYNPGALPISLAVLTFDPASDLILSKLASGECRAVMEVSGGSVAMEWTWPGQKQKGRRASNQ